jgi:hypothetical protein
MTAKTSHKNFGYCTFAAKRGGKKLEKWFGGRACLLLGQSLEIMRNYFAATLLT